jgi:predicted O-methyltransferase YrrM
VNTRLIAGVLADESVLYAVDPFLGGRLPICWSELIARRHVQRGGVGRTVQFLKTFSHEACSRLRGTFDFLFIDGDHSLEGITQDWNDWSGRVAPAGIVALHDTEVPAHNPAIAALGSYRFFHDTIRHDPRFALLEQVDSLNILKRRAD